MNSLASPEQNVDEALCSRVWVSLIDSELVGSTVSLGGVPRELKMLKGHLPRVIYHQLYWYTKIMQPRVGRTNRARGRHEWAREPLSLRLKVHLGPVTRVNKRGKNRLWRRGDGPTSGRDGPAIHCKARIVLENATVRGRAWYIFLDAPVLTLDVTV